MQSKYLEKTRQDEIRAMRCIEMLAGPMTRGQYTSTIQTLVELEPRIGDETIDRLRREIEPELFWQVVQDCQNYRREGHL